MMVVNSFVCVSIFPCFSGTCFCIVFFAACEMPALFAAGGKSLLLRKDRSARAGGTSSHFSLYLGGRDADREIAEKGA